MPVTITCTIDLYVSISLIKVYVNGNGECFPFNLVKLPAVEPIGFLLPSLLEALLQRSENYGPWTKP